MIDNSWFELGTLPPENTECEVFLAAGWSWCRIVANKGSGSWITTKSEDIIIRNDLLKFRPIKSERDKTIEAAYEATKQFYTLSREEILGELYDAGLLRLPD